MPVDFLTTTELAGDEVTREQITRLHHRYVLASRYCAGKDVLEAACGSGQGLALLASVSKSFRAGDCSEPILTVAKKNYGSRIDLRLFDAEEMPFADGSLDVVVLFEAIYYLPTAERFVEECGRVLRKQGKVLVATANKDLYDFNPSAHSTRYYGVAELNQLFRQRGFGAEFYGYLPVGSLSWRQRFLRPVKKFAADFNLIPKTMEGKKLLKKLVFGGLVTMPAELRADETIFEQPSRLAGDKPDSEHKVIYCEATLE